MENVSYLLNLIEEDYLVECLKEVPAKKYPLQSLGVDYMIQYGGILEHIGKRGSGWNTSSSLLGFATPRLCPQIYLGYRVL